MENMLLINWYTRNYPKRAEISSVHMNVISSVHINVREHVSGLKIFFVFCLFIIF